MKGRAVRSFLLAGLVAGAAVSALPAAAGAAVAGSPHDLIAQRYDVPKKEGVPDRCSACHISRTKKGWNFLGRIPPVLGNYPSSSLLCFSCHDGTTLVNVEADASRTAFHPASHGYDAAGYEEDIPSDDSVPLEDSGRLACATCHDAHDNTYRPFLRQHFTELCFTCHGKLADDRSKTSQRRGNHPVMIDPAGTAVESIPLQTADDFRVGLPLPYPLEGGKDAVGVHWDLGGHLEEGSEGNIICSTCHAVHGDEAAAPLPSLLSRDAVRITADEFCEGCHGGERADGKVSGHRPNPGGTLTARTYHPADDDESNGEGRIVDINEPEGWTFGTGSPKEVLCSTCHGAHGTDVETALLRHPEGGDSFCQSCHTESPTIYHHPSGPGVAGDCLDRMPADAEEREGLPCERCHRAHNAGFASGREDRYVPLLREDLLAEDYCSECHPVDDPTCDSPEGGNASHFLGDARLPATYGKPFPTIRTVPWAETGLESRYGGEDGNVMICLSCHSFRNGAIIGLEGEDSPYYLVARAGANIEWEEPEEEEDDDDDGEDIAGAYLCSGCHGINPSAAAGGRSHPMMKADTGKLKEEPSPPVTVTPDGHLNCDSCHLPHRAPNGGGYYILEDVASDNTEPKTVHPKIDFAPLCHHCHGENSY